MRPTISPRAGAACAAVGALGIFLNNFRHPFPPADRVAFLRLIADEPHWAAIHFPTMFFALAALVGLVALADTLAEGAAASLARAGRTVAQVGVPIMLVGVAVDGYGFKAVADAWAAAPATERAVIERAADAIVWAETGLLHTWVAVFLGVPFVLYGAAVAASARYPRWAGWLGVAGGAGCLASGAAGFLRLPIDLPFPIFGTVDLAWLVLMAALMTRRERRAHLRGLGAPA
ncbi:hypothetical protein [Roseisolibacter sp. H3M3-2]|uniref:hypothetical protein n=1 Tax=Roseisolibacter sp. H3M3-2 TaxID=3031323 RepID=UPI0023DA55B3|nr:hypothetical protein [Roseisolibacter sp. H3M3-2]MDF1503193.1 hypothetical protein [Roseisolibacter sp. H3M3-2]